MTDLVHVPPGQLVTDHHAQLTAQYKKLTSDQSALLNEGIVTDQQLQTLKDQKAELEKDAGANADKIKSMDGEIARLNKKITDDLSEQDATMARHDQALDQITNLGQEIMDF